MPSPKNQTGLSSSISHTIIVIGMPPKHQTQLLANLEHNHFNLRFCESPNDATLLLQSTSTVDNTVVLLDEKLFVTENTEIIENFLKNSMVNQFPLILNVYSSNSKAIQQAFKMGIFFYLIQPYSAGLLTSVLETASRGFLQFHDAIQRVHNFNTVHPLLTNASFTLNTIAEAHALSSALAFITNDQKRIGVGLFELMLNAIEHGNLGIGYELKTQLIKESRLQQEIETRQALAENQNKNVQVSLERTSKYIEITISDCGDGFDYSRYLNYSEDRATDKHGRGIMLANSISFDALEYKNSGSTVICRCNLC